MATETAVDVVMPQMGVSVSEGTITKWLKQEGEQVEADEPLLEISTDKVDTEVPSPGSGTLTQILVQEGATVDVGTKLAVIGGEGGGSPSTDDVPEPATAQAAAESAAVSDGPATPTAETVEEATPAPSAASETTEPSSTNGKTFVSPVVAKIASEHGVDPSRVEGTGRGGRVTKKDILAFIESGVPATAPPTPEPAPSPDPQPAPEPAPPAPAPPPQPERPAQAGETLEPVTAMRRGIADHMRRSLDTAAHVTSAIEVDMSKVVGIRKKLKPQFEQNYGVKLTYLAFVARAVTETLRDYPWINGELRGDKIVTRSYVNLGFAVELADGKGLIVPVVKSAETLNLLGMAKGIADLA